MAYEVTANAAKCADKRCIFLTVLGHSCPTARCGDFALTKIIVKNGNWDEAQAKLAADFAAKKSAFDAKFGTAFGAKPEEPKPSTPAPAPAEKPKTRAEIIMSKDSSASVLARSLVRK